MHDHESKRSASVYAVMAIAACLFAAMLWLGLQMLDPVPPPRPVRDHATERHGAGEDILPGILHPPLCDDDRPCS